jgi:predicted extracellular nuclease
VQGVLDYSFGNFKLLNVAPLPPVTGGAVRETAQAPAGGHLSIATYNMENLDPFDGEARFLALADQIVNRLRSPDLVALVEVQDNNGPTNDAVVDGTQAGRMIADAVRSIGGPSYTWRSPPQTTGTGASPAATFVWRTSTARSAAST